MPSERLVQIQRRLVKLFEYDSSESGECNYNSELQLLELGLEEIDIEEMAGRKILDLGCGIGNLVEFLRQRRVDAEGIDPEAPEKPYFMRRRISSEPSEKIPQQDCFYDFVLSHGLTPLGYAFSTSGEEYQDIPSFKLEGEAILSEALRVLRTDGRMIVTPQLDLLDLNHLTRIRAGNYRIEKREVWLWQEFERDLDERGEPHISYEPLKYSTIIHKD